MLFYIILGFLLIITPVLLFVLLLKAIQRRNLHSRLKKEIKEAEKEIEDVKLLEREIQEAGDIKDETRREGVRLKEELYNKDGYTTTENENQL